MPTYKDGDDLIEYDYHIDSGRLRIGGIQCYLKSVDYCCGATFIEGICLRYGDDLYKNSVWEAEDLLHRFLTNMPYWHGVGWNSAREDRAVSNKLTKCKLYWLDVMERDLLVREPRFSCMGLRNDWVVHTDQQVGNFVHDQQTKIVVGEWNNYYKTKISTQKLPDKSAA